MTTVCSAFRYAGLDLAFDLFLEPRAVAFGAVKIARQVIEGYADKLPNFSTAVLLKILRTSLKALARKSRPSPMEPAIREFRPQLLQLP